MKIFTFFTLLCCIALANSLQAQNRVTKAKELYNAYAYEDAAKIYDKYIENTAVEKIDEEILFQAANTHLKLRHFEKANKYYGILKQKAVIFPDEELLNYVKVLRATENYSLSDSLYLAHLKSKSDVKGIERYLDQLNTFKVLRESDNGFKIFNLSINSPYSDFSTSVYNNKIVYSSSSNTEANKNTYRWTGQPYLSLYIADANTEGQLVKPTLFSSELTSKYHEASVVFLNDSLGFLTSSKLEKGKLNLDNNRTNRFSIYRIFKSGGKWVKGGEIFPTSPETSMGHPSVTPNKKYLFFSSDMPGGYGGADIYYAAIDLNGIIARPVNAGPVVNTSFDEMFPFVNGESLFFASDGHVGFGGLDIFESALDIDGKQFKEPVNMGLPVNSNFDDFAYIVDEAYKGYFSSNRNGGKGDDDIYYFIGHPKKCEQVVTGRVIDKLSKIPIYEATVTFYGEDNTVITKTYTNENGFFSGIVPCELKLQIVAHKPTYVDGIRELQSGIINGGYIENVNFELSKIEDVIEKRKDGQEQIKINPIYFEYDKYDITPQAETELTKVLEAFKLFPNLVIKIESHTDSRGSKKYNAALSQKRAESTYNYLISKGISTEKIQSYVGRGEEVLVNNCKDGIACSEEDHAKNRRTEFIIIVR